MKGMWARDCGGRNQCRFERTRERSGPTRSLRKNRHSGGGRRCILLKKSLVGKKKSRPGMGMCGSVEKEKNQGRRKQRLLRRGERGNTPKAQKNAESPFYRYPEEPQPSTAKKKKRTNTEKDWERIGPPYEKKKKKYSGS